MPFSRASIRPFAKDPCNDERSFEIHTTTSRKDDLSALVVTLLNMLFNMDNSLSSHANGPPAGYVVGLGRYNQ